MKLLLVVAGVAVLGVLAWASGFVGDEGGWAGVARIDSLLSAVLALGVIGAFVAAGGRWLSSQVVRGPMARAWGRTSPEAGKGERDAVIDQVVRGAHATTPRPGRVLASVVAIAETDGIRRWPWETPSHQRWFSTVATRLSDGLVPRLFAPDTARAVAHLAHAVARALEGVLHYRVVPAATFERKLVPPGSGSFREVASLLSGALVLVDAVHSRAGTARSMTVWHSVQSRPSGPRFGSSHALGPRGWQEGASECPWGRALAAQPRTLAGDFDGRVLDLVGAAAVQDDRTEGVDFLLLTSETCYAATEVALQSHSDVRCKGLTKEEAQDRPPSWTFDAGNASVRRAESGAARLALVTAFAMIVLRYPTDAGPRESLVFARRSRRTRNGAGVLSVSGGGVVNLPVGDAEGDEDAQGFPDLAASVCREIKEELGLDVPASSAVPTAAYLLNERGPDVSGNGRGRCQLVATAAFAITVPMTFQELVAGQVHASPSKGAYELVDLVEVAMPSPTDRPDAADPTAAAALDFALVLHDLHGGHLDQRAYLAALYAAASRYGQEATVRAFEVAWPDPWWSLPWDRSLEATHIASSRQAVPFDLLVDPEAMARLRKVAEAHGIPLSHG